MDNAKGLLEGLRVLDVGSWYFGPAATTVMSDFGAEVIKIENPAGGDPVRYLYQMAPLPSCELNYVWLVASRNKKSLALNLKRDEGRQVLLELVREADVLVTNYPPGVLASLRIGYDDLAPLNPRLVYAHATGYGETGDEADKPGYDATAYWARSGLMDAVRAEGADPALSVPGLGDAPSAMTLFGGIMMALYQRERSGEGAKVSSSLVANGVWANAVYIQAMLCGAEGYQRVDRRRPANSLVGYYPTRDGRWLMLVLTQEDRDWPRLVKVLERPDLIEDPRFVTLPERRTHAADLAAIFEGIFQSRDLAEWRERLDKAGLTFGAIARSEDAVDDPQMEAAGVFVDLEDPRVGRLRLIDSPISIAGHSKTPPRLAPEIGEHTDEVLRSLGYDASRIQALRDCGAI